MQDAFAGKARCYRSSASHADPEDLARMLRWLALPQGGRVLDVATGAGHTAVALARAGARTVAVDESRGMLREARAHAGEHGLALAAALADAHALPLREASFDAAACRIAAHHFRDLDRAVREMARVLRRGCALYAYDLTAPDDERAARRIDALERLRDPSHVRSWPASAWRDALEGAGLDVERLERRDRDLDAEAWMARAAMPREREAELRARLGGEDPETLGGYGLTGPGTLRVLRVEVLARKA